MRESSQAADAAVVMRRVLSEAADQSVTIVLVGHATNIVDLLESDPLGSEAHGGAPLQTLNNSDSSLTGRMLVARKVKQLVWSTLVTLLWSHAHTYVVCICMLVSGRARMTCLVRALINVGSPILLACVSLHLRISDMPSRSTCCFVCGSVRHKPRSRSGWKLLERRAHRMELRRAARWLVRCCRSCDCACDRAVAFQRTNHLCSI